MTSGTWLKAGGHDIHHNVTHPNDIQHYVPHPNGIQHYNKLIVTLSIMTLSMMELC
jgi:hypothetical protein